MSRSLDYAQALKRYASFGSAWMEETPELDTLWNAVLKAAEPEPDTGKDAQP